MRRWIVTICAALLLGAAVGTARAAGPAIDWDPAYAWEAGATATHSPAGGEFKMVGIISLFDVPFTDLNANLATHEYTFYVHGLISTGTDSIGLPDTRFYTTTYTGGTIEVYDDATPDASFDPFPPNGTVPANFVDGGLPILTGSFTSFVVQTNNFTTYQTGNIEGNINWSGGTLYTRTFSGGGAPCPGLFTGGATWNPAVLIPGYLFRHDGKIDLNCPTPVRRDTWGKVKSLYH